MFGEMLLGLADVKALLLDEVGNRRILNTFLQHQAQPHGEKARLVIVASFSNARAKHVN